MKILILLILLLLPAAYLWSAPGPVATDQRATWFNCTMISTATALTELNGCAVLTSGQSRYITSIAWSSSIISTTTNFMLIQSGTGTACATGTASHYADFALAFTSVQVHFLTPIKTAANAAICFIHPGAGTRNVTVTGYIAP